MSDLGRFSVRAITTESWDGRNVRLVLSFSYTRPESDGGDTITFLAGGDADGASTPLALELVGITHDGLVWPAALGHDRMYRGRVLVNGVPTLLSKETADLIFLEMMRANGMSESKARWYYNGVDQFGRHAFDENRAKLAARDRPQAQGA